MYECVFVCVRAEKRSLGCQVIYKLREKKRQKVDEAQDDLKKQAKD